MKLITEQSDSIEYLIEGNGSREKNYFIEGIYMQSNKRNRNGRVYPKEVLEKAVEKYTREQIEKDRAVGELNHPESPTINLDRVSHKILSLEWNGNNVIGKAKILDTPSGKIVKALMDAEIRLGVSSRGMGSIEEKSGVTLVKDDFILSSVDVVQDPSAHEAFVNGIMEGFEWFIDNGVIRSQKVNLKRKSSSKSSNLQEKLFTDLLLKI
jgi:hypothetical protein